MATIQTVKKYEGKSDREIYDAALKAIPNAGLKVWKTRELARLVMGIGEIEGHEVRCNIVVNMVDKKATIVVESFSFEEDVLKPILDRAAVELDKLLT